MLSVRGICKSLGDWSIKDISFDVGPGRYFVLLGASGAGKTVLLETIAGLSRPDKGEVHLDGRDITNEKIQNRKISLVFQDKTLFVHMTVYDNIAYPLRCKRLTSAQIRRRVDELAADFEIGGLLGRRPQRLSGGEAQRVSLARAVAAQPQCLLLDEPISSLDVKSRPQMRSLLRKISTRAKLPIVHVTHDYTEAVSLGTHIAVLEDGKIAQAGTVKEVFGRPESEFVARFVGIRNFFKGRLKDTDEPEVNTRIFESAGLCFSLLTDSAGGWGHIMVRSEDVTVSNTASQTSARNNFEGKIIDILPAGGGLEVIVEIGGKRSVEVAAKITAESAEGLALRCGKRVWVSFKASAVRYVDGAGPFCGESGNGGPVK